MIILKKVSCNILLARRNFVAMVSEEKAVKTGHKEQ